MDNASTESEPAARYALHAPRGAADPPGPAMLLIPGVPGFTGPGDVRPALEKAWQPGQLSEAAATNTTRLIFERCGELPTQSASGPAPDPATWPPSPWDQLTAAAASAGPDGRVDYPVCDPALPGRVQARVRRQQAITGYHGCSTSLTRSRSTKPQWSTKPQLSEAEQ